MWSELSIIERETQQDYIDTINEVDLENKIKNKKI